MDEAETTLSGRAFRSWWTVATAKARVLTAESLKDSTARCEALVKFNIAIFVINYNFLKAQ